MTPTTSSSELAKSSELANALEDTTAGTIELGDRPVRRLGFGAMRITGAGIWGPPDDHDEAIAVLRRAVELGINLIDTANSYGPEVSENLIAEALYPYPADLVIATKGGLVRPGPDQWEPNGRPEHLREECEGSLRRLKLERIHLYQFHRPTPTWPWRSRSAPSPSSAAKERSPTWACPTSRSKSCGGPRPSCPSSLCRTATTSSSART